MQLTKTKEFMEKLKEEGTFDSYALLFRRGKEKEFLFSENANCDTYFDIASMGKILITATLILKAIGEKKLSLDDTLDMFFENIAEDRKSITIKQLLTHTSGVVRCFLPKEIAEKGNDALAKYILDNPLAYKPGEGKIYSCNAYILLGFIVEKIYKMPLDKAFYSYTKKELGLTRSRFNIDIHEANATVSYSRLEVGDCRCDDENVCNMGGIAGNGAQFWTLSDMEKYCDAIMEKSEKLYAPNIYALAEQNYTGNLGENANGLGWLIVDKRYRQTGNLFPKGSFGHCGHTGTSFFFNRKKDIYAIILTNATRCLWLKNNCTEDYSLVCRMREDIHNKIAEEIEKI